MTAFCKQLHIHLCNLVALFVFLGFLIFIAYSIHVGISKDNIYVGPIGLSLAVYSLSFLILFIIWVFLIIWIRFVRRQSCKFCVIMFGGSCTLTLVTYVFWQVYVRHLLLHG